MRVMSAILIPLGWPAMAAAHVDAMAPLQHAAEHAGPLAWLLPLMALGLSALAVGRRH